MVFKAELTLSSTISAAWSDKSAIEDTTLLVSSCLTSFSKSPKSMPIYVTIKTMDIISPNVLNTIHAFFLSINPPFPLFYISYCTL